MVDIIDDTCELVYTLKLKKKLGGVPRFSSETYFQTLQPRFQSHTVGSHTKDFIPDVERHPTPKISTQKSPGVGKSKSKRTRKRKSTSMCKKVNIQQDRTGDPTNQTRQDDRERSCRAGMLQAGPLPNLAPTSLAQPLQT